MYFLESQQVYKGGISLSFDIGIADDSVQLI